MPRMTPSYPFVNAESEVDRLRSLMHEALTLSRCSQRELERRLGVSQGYLTQLFNGRMRLNVAHIIVLGQQIGFSPLELFSAAQGAGWPRCIRARLAGGPSAPEQKPAARATDERDLRQLEAGFDAFVRLLRRSI